MPKQEEVQAWLQTNYDLEEDDAEYLSGLVKANDRDAIIESFTTDESDTESVIDQVDRLMVAYNGQFQSDKPRPKPKPLTFVPAEPSPNAEVPEEEVDEVTSKVKTKSKRARKVTSQPEAVESQPKVRKHKPPEVRVTDISAPPEYPPSHGMGIGQIQLLGKLIESLHGKPFDRFDPDSGIPLDKARPAFATLLMRGGVCEVVDAIKVKKSGKKYWSKKVIPILPRALDVIDDFKKRKPDKCKLIE